MQHLRAARFSPAIEFSIKISCFLRKSPLDRFLLGSGKTAQMNTRSSSTSPAALIAITFIVVITFPLWIGILGGAIGIVAGVFGAVIGAMAAVFGILLLPFKILFHFNAFLILMVIIIAFLLVHKGRK